MAYPSPRLAATRLPPLPPKRSLSPVQVPGRAVSRSTNCVEAGWSACEQNNEELRLVEAGGSPASKDGARCSANENRREVHLAATLLHHEANTALGAMFLGQGLLAALQTLREAILRNVDVLAQRLLGGDVFLRTSRR